MYPMQPMQKDMNEQAHDGVWSCLLMISLQHKFLYLYPVLHSKSHMESFFYNNNAIITLSIESPSRSSPSCAARLLPMTSLMYSLQPRTTPYSETITLAGKETSNNDLIWDDYWSTTSCPRKDICCHKSDIIKSDTRPKGSQSGDYIKPFQSSSNVSCGHIWVSIHTPTPEL